MSAHSRRSVVVFPAPFGPRNPNTSPSCTSRSSPSTAASEPKRFVSFSVRITVFMWRVYWRSVPILDRVTPIDAERKLQELSFLHEVAQLASSARDWDEMLRIVIDRTTDAMRVEVSSLYLLERREGVLRLVATNGLNRKFIGKATLRVGEGITGWVANARVPAAVRQVRADPRFKWVPGVDEERFTSMLSVPLLIHDEVVGVVNVQSVAERGFDLDEIEYLQTIANLVAGIIEKGRLQRE